MPVIKKRWIKAVLITTAFLVFPSILLAKSLPVPFTPQAPFANWAQPWQDTCEEASIVMVDNFYANKTLDKWQAKDQMLKVLEIKNKEYGWSLDESAEKIAGLINKFFPWEAHVVDNPSLEQIKNEINNSRPIIIPVYGRAIHNPHFWGGGPDYHVLVISGYDDEKQEFITKEPGTRHGLDFRYKYDTIMNALHDFTWRGNTRNGDPVAVFTRKNLVTSGGSDADEDGLSKDKEIQYNTLLWSKDSDNDGYSDGEEVKTGYSPTVAEKKLSQGSLIKEEGDSKVYFLQNNTKKHIINETVFLKHKWKWHSILTVSKEFLKNLTTGNQITE